MFCENFTKSASHRWVSAKTCLFVPGVLLFHCPTDVRLMFDRTNKSLSEEPSERLADESNDRNLTAGHEPSKDEEKMI